MCIVFLFSFILLFTVIWTLRSLPKLPEKRDLVLYNLDYTL